MAHPALLTCPFCGGSAEINRIVIVCVDGPNEIIYAAVCRSCRATNEVDDAFQTAEDAAAHWNHRRLRHTADQMIWRLMLDRELWVWLTSNVVDTSGERI